MMVPTAASEPGRRKGHFVVAPYRCREIEQPKQRRLIEVRHVMIGRSKIHAGAPSLHNAGIQPFAPSNSDRWRLAK